MKTFKWLYHYMYWILERRFSIMTTLLASSLFFLWTLLINAEGGQVKNNGMFKSMYVPVENSEYVELEKVLKESRLFEMLAGQLNKMIALPVDISIVLKECGVENAYFNPNSNEISMCYELMDHFMILLISNAETPKSEIFHEWVNIIGFVFFHELGHALIHVLDLPVTGKEEDAADQVATFYLSGGKNDGEAPAIAGAVWFLLEEKQNPAALNKLAFWDEHSLGMQRFYNILCWVYGHNQQKYTYFVEKEYLPMDRAKRCPNEYAKLSKSWNSILAPYMKK